MLRINYRDALQEILSIYNQYLETTTNDAVRGKAQIIYMRYCDAMPIFDRDVQWAINLLVDIGWDTGIRPNKSTAREVKVLLQRKLRGSYPVAPADESRSKKASHS